MNFSDDQVVVVVDVETTGLSAPFGDRICEIGLVRARGDAILDTYQTLVNPQRPISPGARRVNGLSDAELQHAPLFASIADQVLARINGAVLVCHNAPFDLGFLEAEYARLNQTWQPAGVIDTLVLARSYFNFDSNSLAAIAKILGIETPQAHRALGDALTTLQVYRRFSSSLAGGGWESGESSYILQAQLEAVVLPPEIQDALAENKEVIITYIDSKGDETTRRITPRSVRAVSGVVYLTAYCHLRNAERSFRLDRIYGIDRIV